MPFLNPQFFSKKFKIDDLEEIGFVATNAKQSNDGNMIKVHNPLILYFKLKE